MKDNRLGIGLISAMLGGFFGLQSPPSLASEGPRVHALTEVRIVVAPGKEIASGTVVLRDGIIESASESAEVPPDARIWPGDGATVYPGLIEPYAVLPWPELDEESAPAGSHSNPLVNPQRDMTFYGHDEKLAEKLRAAGFTTAAVAPKNGLFRGRSVFVALGEGSIKENLLTREIAQNVTLNTQADEGYPGSKMGSIALFRQTMLDAVWYLNAHAAFAQNPAQLRPSFDASLEALAAASAGKEPIVFESSDLLDTLRTLELVQELELKAWLVASGEEYKRLELLNGSEIPLIVPVNFPEEPTLGETDDLTVSLEELRHWDMAPDNPRLLLGLGSSVALTTFRLDSPATIHEHLSRAIARGLEPEAALAALTTTPAQLLGASDRMGTLEAGKVANLVVVEGDLFVEKPKIRAVWVDGKNFPVKETKPPEIDPAGTWELAIDAGENGQLNATLELVGEATDLTGHITTSAGTRPLTSAEVSGKTLVIIFNSPALGEVRMSLSGTDDSLKGSGNADQATFKVKGHRLSKPELEVAS